MKPLRCVLPVLVALLVLSGAAEASGQCAWPAWEQFRQNLISADGRVIDPYEGADITTSEGQAYGLFFALVADDRASFRRLLRWTHDNLAGGDLAARLPAWKWGRDNAGNWGVLDGNSASDADLWIAYSLLEAGRLWRAYGYSSLGAVLLQRIAREEVRQLPGLGPMLLPGREGFDDEAAQRWRLNPSYLPLQVLARFAEQPGPWHDMHDGALRLLLETAPHGYAPDWAAWQAQAGWQPDPVHGAAGDYDAIRVYLWAGMLDDAAPGQQALRDRYAPIVQATVKQGVPPLTADAATGRTTGAGPVGFSAALLPLLAGAPGLDAQRERLRQSPPAPTAYYNQVLTLFGQGWDEGRYRFDQDGRLIREASCAK